MVSLFVVEALSTKIAAPSSVPPSQDLFTAVPPAFPHPGADTKNHYISSTLTIGVAMSGMLI